MPLTFSKFASYAWPRKSASFCSIWPRVTPDVPTHSTSTRGLVGPVRGRIFYESEADDYYSRTVELTLRSDGRRKYFEERRRTGTAPP